MAEVITRLKVESNEYDQKLKRAASALQRMTQEAKRTGAALELADKEEVAFVRSLGKMQTTASSTRGQLREMTETLAQLKVHYAELTAEERRSPYGEALSGSIQELTQRAGNLQDVMGDLQEEIRHVASDTQFTDGLNMMTGAIGSCASAVVAWTGDSKEMEEMIRELAKIETTIRAVENLTKAFQKQNLVLLKNPYILIAAALTAVGVAAYEVIRRMNELTDEQKDLNEILQAGRDGVAKEATQLQVLSGIVHDNAASLDERRKALSALQDMVPEYHGALTEEGELIGDNTDALDAYIDNLQRAATAQAAFDRMVELQKEKLDAQVKMQEAQSRLGNLQAGPGPVVATGGAGSISGASAAGMSYASEAATIEAEIRKEAEKIAAAERRIESLQGFVSADTVASSAEVKGVSEEAAAGMSKVEESSDLVAGSIAAQMAEVQRLEDAYLHAGPEIAGVFLNAFEDAKRTLQEMKENAEEAGRALKSSFDPQAPADMTEAIAAMNVELAKQREMNVANSVEVGKAVGSWRDAVAAIGQAGGALQSMEDPALRVTGIVMQAIANIALGFSHAAANSGKEGNVWTWVAASVTGLATMLSTISAIKSATEYHADGGVVGMKGLRRGTDVVPAMLTPGEIVLNAAGTSNVANAIQSSGRGGKSVVSGEQLVMVINNYGRRTGRGELIHL